MIARHRHFKTAAVALALGLGGCDAFRLGVANAAGPIADSQWHLYIIVAIVLIFVAGPVLLLTPFMAWHYRLSNKNGAFRPAWDFSWWLEALIWLPPTGIVIGLSVLLWDYTHRLDPYRPLRSPRPALEIQVVALDWKWLFIYPGEQVAAVNQMAIPVGRPVHLSLTSATVMQSMLVPRLAGQIYAMPGMKTELNFAADRPGIYLGENVQFNGARFQEEKFDVVALPPAAYQRWLSRARNAPHPLDAGAYNGLLGPSTVPHPMFFSTVADGLFGLALTHPNSSSTGKR